MSSLSSGGSSTRRRGRRALATASRATRSPRTSLTTLSVTPYISFAIQAHPARAEMAEALARDLQAEIVYDPAPESPLRSPWRTFRHLLETTPGEATHRFQIQDDAVVCPHLREAVQAAVTARPDRVVVFCVTGNPYHHAQAVRAACAADEPWARLDYAYWLPLISTCWPVGLIEPFMDWVDAQQWPPEFCADDEICGRYLREIEHSALATVPSLVDHPDRNTSLIGLRAWAGEDPGRIAACWIGACQDCTDARTIDWS